MTLRVIDVAEEDEDEYFEYHAPNDEQLARLQIMREAAKVYARVLRKCLPAGRHRALARTAVEESSMWANKGAVFSEDV